MRNECGGIFVVCGDIENILLHGMIQANCSMVLVAISELRGSNNTGPCYQKEGIESIIGRSGIGLSISRQRRLVPISRS
jgi:hypothetical protein